MSSAYTVRPQCAHFILLTLPSGNRAQNIYAETNRLPRQRQKAFKLVPDITLKTHGKTYIIDTKYKLLSPEDKTLGISQQDMYQIYTYTTKAKAEKALLLYPKHLTQINKKWHIKTQNKTIEITANTINLSTDLAKTKKYSKQLKQILDQLTA